MDNVSGLSSQATIEYISIHNYKRKRDRRKDWWPLPCGRVKNTSRGYSNASAVTNIFGKTLSSQTTHASQFSPNLVSILDLVHALQLCVLILPWQLILEKSKTTWHTFFVVFIFLLSNGSLTTIRSHFYHSSWVKEVSIYWKFSQKYQISFVNLLMSFTWLYIGRKICWKDEYDK